MDAYMNRSDMRAVIGEVLTKRFPKLHVHAINVHASDEDDSQENVRVSVVIEAPRARDFDPAKIPGCLSEIIDQLAADSPFPVLSFIAKSELGKTKPEAA